MWSALATTITAGFLALGLIVSITVLLVFDKSVPQEFPTLLSGLVTAGVVGAAVQQGKASTG